MGMPGQERKMRSGVMKWALGGVWTQSMSRKAEMILSSHGMRLRYGEVIGGVGVG
jgi:hypothetical protein